MKAPFILLSLFVVLFSRLEAQQWVYGENPTWLFAYDGEVANQYPSNIVISGANPYIVGVDIEFPDFYHQGNFRGLDLMLESPGGKRVLLMSDFDYQYSQFLITDAGFSSFSNKPLSLHQFYAFNKYLPANYGTEADSFPFPGPGLIPAAEQTFASLSNENPNGTWKLWAVDDSLDGSYFSLGDGWKLAILSSPVPLCLQPELPVVSAISDSTAQFAWTGNGPAAHWDLLIGLDSIAEPDMNTVPTVSGSSVDTFFASGLEAGKNYKFYVRSVCDDGSRSFWVGPIEFKTLFTPCLHPNPLEICKTVNCDTIEEFSGFPIQMNCGYEPRWVFRFVAPETGAYWISSGQFGIGIFHEAYWMLDDPNSTECPLTGWKCLSQNAGVYPPGFLDTLIAGQAYFLMLANAFESPVFRISRCPALEIHADQVSGPGFFEPFSATIQLSGVGGFLSGAFQTFYTTDSTFVPGDNTPGSEPGFVLFPGDNGLYHLQTNSLSPSSKYRLWVRNFCENGSRPGCWEGPFVFNTGTFCGTFDSVWFDQITQNSARLNLIAPPAFIVNYSTKINGQFIQNGTGSMFIDSAGQVLSRVLTNLEPATTYEIYLKANCFPSGQDNATYGPFIFTTAAGCIMPYSDVSCYEIVHPAENEFHSVNTSENLFYGSDQGCNFNQLNNASENLYRFTAPNDGISTVYPAGEMLGSPALSWYYSDSLDGCNSAAFKYIGCWGQGLSSSGLSFPTQAGHTYFLLCDGFLYPGNFVGGIAFYLDCGAPFNCPGTDSLWFDAKTSTSATLRWKNVSPGATWRVYYQPQETNGVDEQFVETSDTTITLTGLLPSARYAFSLRNICIGGVPVYATGGYLQLGDNEVRVEAVLTRCNPQFTPSGQSVAANFETFELTVPQNGDYRVIATPWTNLYLYKDQFDAENPAVNLLLGVSENDAEGRIDTVYNFQAGKSYFIVTCGSYHYPSPAFFNTSGYNNLSVLVDGPTEATIGAATTKSKEWGAHGKIPDAGVFWHAGVCLDTAGWAHYYTLADAPYNYEDDKLLFSVQLNKESDALNALPMILVNDPPAAVLIQNPPATFIQNPDGWYEMNRTWLMQDLTPVQQIDEDFKIRFYYTQHDYELMKAAIEAQGGQLDTHEAMYFHKINGFHNYQNVIPWAQHNGIPAASAYDSIGYWSYKNGVEASSNTWRHGLFAGEHYAEMLVHGFSGGGGGASVNGRNISDPLSETHDALLTKVVIAPNPNTGVFNINLPMPAPEGSVFRILDLRGQLLKSQLLKPGSTAQSVQASELPAGLYFLQVTSGEKIVALGKFVKL